jgi:hypothetical protein
MASAQSATRNFGSKLNFSFKAYSFKELKTKAKSSVASLSHTTNQLDETIYCYQQHQPQCMNILAISAYMLHQSL